MKASRIPTVYLLYSPEVKRMKVGSSSDVVDRILSLQRMSPCRLRLYGLLRGLKESALHNNPKLRRSRVHGEWYDQTAEFMLEIDRIMSLYGISDFPVCLHEIMLGIYGEAV